MAFASLDLSGRTAVVVGGTTGIGRALTWAGAGADVAPTSRRKDVVDEAAALVEAAGRRTPRVTTDVADEVSIASPRGRDEAWR
jgi:NAD(P)-dependent dehydrogenase (short-subunit alcohol dehydrogenase family)